LVITLYLVNDVMVKCEMKMWYVTVEVGICLDPMGNPLEQIIFINWNRSFPYSIGMDHFSCRMRIIPREHTKW